MLICIKYAEVHITLEKPRLQELVLRSFDAAWTDECWKSLPDDGNRYEIIDEVLYMTTAPMFFING